jgi:hypothetical protein
MAEIEYLTDKNGRPKAVVIPIELWRQICPHDDTDTPMAELSEEIEDYCLNKAMDQAQDSPLLDQGEALKYLKEE